LPSTRGSYKYLLATSRLGYKLTRNIEADLIYTFINIDNDVAGLQYQVSRHQVGFALTAEWN